MHELPRRPLPLVLNLTGRHCLGLDVSGPGGGQWHLLLHDGRLTAAENGLSPQCSAVFQLDARTFLRWARRELAAAEAVRSGRLVIAGNGLEPTRLEAILQAAAARETQPVIEPS